MNILIKRGIRMTWLLSHRYNRYDPNKPETMKKHINELRLKNNEFVWWGVIQKSYSKAPISDKKIKCLENQIKNQIETNVFFIENKGTFKSGMREAYRGTLIQTESFKPENSHKESPAYYHNSKHRLWLKLSKIEQIPINSISRLVEKVDISPQTTLRLLKVEDYL